MPEIAYTGEMTVGNLYAKWCKPGKHAFDPDDPEQKEVIVRDPVSGAQVKIITCGEHLIQLFELAGESALPKDPDNN